MSATPPTSTDVRCFDLERGDSVCVASLHGGHHEETWIQRLGDELSHLIQHAQCRRLVIAFGNFECLYSLLMGKLVMLQRQMEGVGGRMKICDVPPHIREVFRICKLEDFFEFAPDRESAIRDW